MAAMSHGRLPHASLPLGLRADRGAAYTPLVITPKQTAKPRWTTTRAKVWAFLLPPLAQNVHLEGGSGGQEEG